MDCLLFNSRIHLKLNQGELREEIRVAQEKRAKRN